MSENIQSPHSNMGTCEVCGRWTYVSNTIEFGIMYQHNNPEGKKCPGSGTYCQEVPDEVRLDKRLIAKTDGKK